MRAGAAERGRLDRLNALNRSLQGVTDRTAEQLRFGYAAVIREQPSGCSCTPQLAQYRYRQFSIASAHCRLDYPALAALDGKRIVVGRIDLADPNVASFGAIVPRMQRALPFVPPESTVLPPNCDMTCSPCQTVADKLRAMVEAATVLRHLHGVAG